MTIPQLTNAVKAQAIVCVNAVLAVADAFGGLSDARSSAIALAVNALLGLWVALTYKSSPKRIPDK